MITFKEFITEGKFIKSLRYDKSVDVLKILKTRCSEFIKASRLPIYRGFRSGNESWYIAQPSKYERKSNQDAKGNLYTLLFDNLNSWQKYPKRSKSLICTTIENVAEQYGQCYYIIPFDGAKWGVCPNDDIWNSFYTLKDFIDSSTLEDFHYEFSNIVGMLQKIFPKEMSKYDFMKIRNTSNFKDFLDLLKSMDKCIGKMQDPKEFNKSNPKLFNTYFGIYDKNFNYDQVYGIQPILKYFLKNRKKYGNIGNILANVFDPIKNGFVLSDNKSIKKTLIYGDNREIWTDSDCVIIHPERFFRKFIKQALKQEAIEFVDKTFKNLSKNDREDEVRDKYEDLLVKYSKENGTYQWIRDKILK